MLKSRVTAAVSHPGCMKPGGRVALLLRLGKCSPWLGPGLASELGLGFGLGLGLGLGIGIGLGLANLVRVPAARRRSVDELPWAANHLVRVRVRVKLS